MGRIVKSGEVACCLSRCIGRGSLVGLFSLIMVKVESFMMLFMVIPLWSLLGENHVWWWALKSPVIMMLSRLSSWLNKVVVLLLSMSVVEDLGGI